MMTSPFATLSCFLFPHDEDDHEDHEDMRDMRMHPPRTLFVTRLLSSSKSMDAETLAKRNIALTHYKKKELYTQNVGVLMVRYKKPFRVRFQED